MDTLTFGIITVSDTCYSKEKKDTAGPKLADEIKKCFPKSVITFQKIVEDNRKMIADVLSISAEENVSNVIFTVGGTGFSPRDVTPEATKDVIDKDASVMAYAILSKSLEITEMAMLSRAVCGIINKTLVINLPGSAKAAVECFSFIQNVLPHAVAVLTDRKIVVEKVHSQIQATTASKVKVNQVAWRLRTSKYPMVEVADALNIIQTECSPNTDTEIVHFEDSSGRVLAEDVVALEPVPSFRASMKDGYAIIVNDSVVERKVVNVVTAGDSPNDSALQHDEAVRISTGAALPPTANAVVQVEDTTLIKASEDGTKEEFIKIMSPVSVGRDIREIGSDIAENTLVFEKQHKITNFDIGVFAMLGKTEVRVFRRPTIAVISTGNELKTPREKLQPGQIRDSNKVTLLHLLKRYGYDGKDLGIAKDDPDSVKTILEKAFTSCDVIITSGGVSMGERDIIKDVLVQDFNAIIHFGRVNMKPGKPTTFATLIYNGRLKLIFGLPGNPVSCSVTCLLFVIPTLRFLERNKHCKFPEVQATYTPLFKVPDDPRPEYVRVNVTWKSGNFTANSMGSQVSSRLNSMVDANGLLILKNDKNNVQMQTSPFSQSNNTTTQLANTIPIASTFQSMEQFKQHQSATTTTPNNTGIFNQYTVILFGELSY